MKQSIKEYAETLYAGAQMQSGADARRARSDFQQQRGAQTRSVHSILSGPELEKLVAIFTEHIGKCVQARFDAYEKAFDEDESFPSAEDFSEILDRCRRVQAREISHAVTATREFIARNGGGVSGAPIPNEPTFQAASAEYMDFTVHGWKAWKAKAQLKSASKNIPVLVPVPEKQFDVLLRVYNRAEFDKDLQEQTKGATDCAPVSLLFMDLDKFKHINDGPGGHAAGDRALKAFAEAVLNASRHKGEVYRYGGDELCVLFRNHSLDEAWVVAERIRQTVRAIKTEELTDGLRTSIGVASVPESTSDSTRLCDLADKAMYESKKAGGDRITVAEDAVTTT